MELNDAEDSSDVSVSDNDSSEEDMPSETRRIREMGNGERELESTRPAPTRHEPPPKPAPAISRVNSLFNYMAVKPIPIADVKSNKKQERRELDTVEPSRIKV